MTLRLANLFEAQLKAMSVSSRKAYKLRPPRKTMNTRGTANGGTGTSRTAAIAAAAATAAAAAASYNSNDSDDDSIQTERPAAARNGRQLRRNPAAHTSNSNGVSSSMHADHNEPMPGPSTSSGRFQRRAPRQSQSPSRDVDDLSDSPSSSSTSDGDSDDDAALPLSSLGVSSKQRKKIDDSNSDSGESYKPNRRNAHSRKNKKSQRKSKKNDKDSMKRGGGGSLRSATKTTKRRRNDRSDENDDDEDDDYDANVDNHDDDINDEDYNVHRTPKKRSPARPRRTKKHSNMDTSSAEDSKRKSGSKRMRHYESDHSYHMNTAPSSAHKRRISMDTESESEQPRPTRSRGKKLPPAQKPPSQPARTSWASRETDHSPEEEPNVIQNTSHHRPLRSTRNRVSQEKESDDDQVLSQLSSNSTRNRPRRNYRKSCVFIHFSF